MKIKRLISFLIIIIMLFNINLNLSASNLFYDTIGHWAFEDIFWASNNVLLFVGYEDGNFRPDNNITIAEYLAILFRAADANGLLNNNYFSEYKNEDSVNPLKNIKITEDHWAYYHVLNIMQYITNKNSDFNLFKNNTNPNRPITREEAVVLTSYFTTYPLNETKINFKDISANYKYKKELKNLVNNGIIIGYKDNTFRPLNNITRAESTTLIKNAYFEMRYLKDEYLKNIDIIKGIFDEKFMHYGKYFEGRELNKDDMAYIKVISTFEMLDISGRIPYNERENYDSNPVKTLNELKNKGYWNKIGLNYYLINNGDYNSDVKINLANELANEYLKRNDLEDHESLRIITTIMSYIKDDKIIISCLNKWEENINEDYQKLNVLFLKEKLFIMTGNYEEALLEYEKDYKIDSLENSKIFAFNKAILLLNMNKFDEAISFLKTQWNLIKKYDGYLELSDEIDREFKGSIKKILIEKNNYTQNNDSRNMLIVLDI